MKYNIINPAFMGRFESSEASVSCDSVEDLGVGTPELVSDSKETRFDGSSY